MTQALNGFLAKAGGKDKLTALIQVRYLVGGPECGKPLYFALDGSAQVTELINSEFNC